MYAKMFKKVAEGAKKKARDQGKERRPIKGEE